MVEISTVADFINNFFFVYLILVITHLLEGYYRKRYIITDLLVSIVVGFLGLPLQDVNLLVWLVSVIIYQKIYYKKLNYTHLNYRLLASIIVEITGLFVDCLDLLVRPCFSVIMGFNISNDQLTYIDIFFNIILVFLFMLFIYNHKIQLYKIYHSVKILNLESRIFIFLIFLLASIIFILFLSQYMQITTYIKLPLMITFLIFVLLTGIQLMSFVKTVIYQHKIETKATENEQLQKYLENIEAQYQEERHFRHDYNNMILALEQFTKNNNQKQFKDYYYQLVKHRPKYDNLESISHLSYIKNEPIRGILIQKVFYAKKLGIDLKLEIGESIKIENNDILSIVRIIGILLDNAIEHVTKEKNKLVVCAFIKVNKQINITIDNMATNIKNIDQFSKNGFTTKSGHKGYGLFNVKKIINQSDKFFFEVEWINQHLQTTLMIIGE